MQVPNSQLYACKVQVLAKVSGGYTPEEAGPRLVGVVVHRLGRVEERGVGADHEEGVAPEAEVGGRWIRFFKKNCLIFAPPGVSVNLYRPGYQSTCFCI